MEHVLIVVGIFVVLVGWIWLKFLLMSDESEYSFGAKILGTEVLYAFYNLKRCWLPLLIYLMGVVLVIIGVRLN